MPIPVDSAATLAGGSLVTGITLVLTTQVLWSFGVEFNLSHDRKRQTVLNFICFLASINGMIAYPANQTAQSSWVSNITTLFTFTFVQYGLVIINHNSISRANNISTSYQLSKRTLNSLCYVLYLLPLLTLMPIILASIERIPHGDMINKSDYNTFIYKPLNIGLVVATELFAAVTDILLLRQVITVQAELLHYNSTVSSNRKHNIRAVSRDLMGNYAVTWTLLVLDILVKVLIIYKFPVLFDSIISIATLAMRARCNLLYGLNMKNIFETTRIPSSGKSSQKTSVFGTNYSIVKVEVE